MKETTKPIPTTTRINKLLAKAGYKFRLVRGHGYYYLSGEGSGALYASSLYSYRLLPEDFEYALREVNEMLRESNLATI
jgi:hypothetical protein